MSRALNTKKPLYVLTEGITELHYLQDFAKCAPKVKITLVARNPSRPALLKEALRFSTDTKSDCWIIFDKDDKLKEAKEIYERVAIFNQKGNATINIAYLAPCFEVWPLLHFKQTNISTSPKKVQKELGQYIQYDHGKSPIVEVKKLEQGYDLAVKTAQNWESSLSDAPEYEAGLLANIYKLTEFIKNMR